MLTIGKLATATGVKVPTIRYYEQIGLLPGADRSSGNQRLYAPAAQERLAFIRHARDLGQSCAEADAIARAQLIAVEGRIARLQALRGELARMLDHGTGGRIAECRVIEVLGNHQHCSADHAPDRHGLSE